MCENVLSAIFDWMNPSNRSWLDVPLCDASAARRNKKETRADNLSGDFDSFNMIKRKKGINRGT